MRGTRVTWEAAAKELADKAASPAPTPPSEQMSADEFEAHVHQPPVTGTLTARPTVAPSEGAAASVGPASTVTPTDDEIILTAVPQELGEAGGKRGWLGCYILGYRNGLAARGLAAENALVVAMRVLRELNDAVTALAKEFDKPITNENAYKWLALNYAGKRAKEVCATIPQSFDAYSPDAAAVPSMQDASLGCGDSTKVE